MSEMNMSDNRIDLSIKKKKKKYLEKAARVRSGNLNMKLLPEKCKRRQVCQAEGGTAEVICHPHAVDPTARLLASWRQLMKWVCARRLSWSPHLCRGHSGHARPFKHPSFHLCLKQEDVTLLITFPFPFCQATIKKSFGNYTTQKNPYPSWVYQ